MTRTMKIMIVVSFLALIGMFITYHKGMRAEQGVLSGIMMTSFSAYILIDNDEERRKRNDRRNEKADRDRAC